MLMRRRSVVAWMGGSALLFARRRLPAAVRRPERARLGARLAATGAGLVDSHEPAPVTDPAGPVSRAAHWRSLAACSSRCCRDALATPYTLGVSTGASLGAVIAIAFDWHTVAGVVGIWAGALAGAGLILFVVMGAATRGGQLSSSSLLLAGIAINSVCAALILLVHGLTGMSQSFAISRWLIGGLDAIERPTLLVYVLVVIGTGLIVIRQGRQWNLLAVGEAWAATRGARGAARPLSTGYVAGSILAATTVALTGPIGFVGLVVPHLLRGRLGGDDRLLMPCAFLLGGVLLASCDALGRVLLAPAEIPAGAITAFIGGPYLIWVIRRGGMR